MVVDERRRDITELRHLMRRADQPETQHGEHQPVGGDAMKSVTKIGMRSQLMVCT